MPSSYSSSLRLELQASGENANTWGTKTNNNLNLIEQAIAGYTKITLTSASATYNLTIADASASEGRNAFIEFAGTVASAISIVVPDAEKGYWVRNSATGSPLTFRTSSGTGLTLPTNEWVFLIADGTSVVSTLPTSLTNYARLAAANTFTNANTFTSAVTLQGPVSVVGATTFTSAVTFSGATSLASTLVVNSTATFNGVVSVSGTLYPKFIIGGSAAFIDNLDVGGRVDIHNNVSIAGALALNSTFTVSGASFLTSAVTITGPTSIANTLRVQSTATFDSNVSVSGSLGVFGAATFSSAVSINTLTVSNNATLNGNVSVSGSLVVGGDIRGLGIIRTTATVTYAASTGTAEVWFKNSGNQRGFRIDSFGISGAEAPVWNIFTTYTNGSSLFGNTIESRSARGSYASPSAVGSGDLLGNLYFTGYDGSAFLNTAAIRVKVSGTVSVGSAPTELRIAVKDSGNASSDSGLLVFKEDQVIFNPRVSAPTTPQKGCVYFDSTLNKLRCYDGTTWNDLF